MDETTANFVSLADAAGRALSLLHRFIDDWQNIPSDVCELRDDIDRLSSLLESVRRTVVKGQPVFQTSHPDALAALSRDVTSARTCLDAVRLLITSFPGQSKSGLGGPKLNSLPPLWKSAWLRRRHEIAQVKTSIRESSENILSRLLLLNVTVSADIYESVRQQERGSHNFQKQLVRHIDRRFDALSSAVHAVGTASTQSSASLMRRDAQNEARFQRLEALLSAAVVPMMSSTLLPRRKSGPQASRRCRCACHSTVTTRYELSTFANALGSFSFGYVRSHPSSAAGRPCKLRCCTTQNFPAKLFRIVYTFPSWLLHTAITAVFTDTTSPELLLRIHRRIPMRFDVFHHSLVGFAGVNKIDEAQRCLRQRLGALTDIVEESGCSPLDIALMKRNLDMSVLFLREGADIFQDTSCFGATCVMFIQDMYANPGLPDWRGFEQLIPMERILAYMDLSVLHEAVLNIRHTNIRDLLEQEICPVDARDISGRTALYYATARGDTDSVEALLAAGAQPDAGDLDRSVPLSTLAEACRQGFVDIVHLLLSAGADVNVKYTGGASGGGGWSPLHRLGGSGKDAIEIAAELLRRGAYIDTGDDVGLSTPLHQASYRDSWELVDFYIRAGADLNRRDREGTTPLECAVACSASRAATTLLRHGAGYTNVDEYGHNVLHHLAFYSDIATMEVFIDEGTLVGLDVTRENMHGKTPLQLFNSRAHITEDLRANFERLLEAASGQGLSGGVASLVEDEEEEEDDEEEEEEEEEEEDDDLFFDAPAPRDGGIENPPKSYSDALSPGTIDGSSVPILKAPSGGCLSALLHQHEDEALEDLYVDTNKYRFPEHMNDNSSKVLRNVRMEHLEREAESLPSPPYLEGTCPSPRHEEKEDSSLEPLSTTRTKTQSKKVSDII
ncbi:unnamed protein product [Discula destructiva]